MTHMHTGIVAFNDVDYGLDLANALHRSGVTVSLFMSHKHISSVVDDKKKTKERVYELGLLDKGIRVFIFQFPRLRSLRSFGVLRDLSRSMRTNDINVAHLLIGPGEVWLALLALLLKKIPVVSTIIIPIKNVGENLPGFIFSIVNILITKASDMIIVNGADQVPLVEKAYKIPAERVAYVPLGPRTTATRWSGSKFTEETGAVLFFGEARAHKGLEYLIRAQPIVNRRIPNSRFLIATRTTDFGYYDRLIEDVAKFEIHKGFADGFAVASYFERASVVVLPYLSASTSGILLTAYVFGKPVVATSVGCLPDYVINDDTGILVPPADERRLAEAIIRLLSNDKERRRMGENARRWAADLEKKAVASTIDVYKRAMNLHGSSIQIN